MDNAELLARYARKPDRRLRDRIVTANLGLAKKIANRHAKNCREPFEDLLQVACIGLAKAVDAFDITRGLQFSTLAGAKIRSEIMHYLRDKSSPVKIPRRWQDNRRKFLEMMQAGADPEEIAAVTRISVLEQSDAWVALQYRPLVSLDKPVGEDEDQPYEVVGQTGTVDPTIKVGDVLLMVGAQMRNGEYFNATAICKEEGRQFSEFFRLPSTKRRIAEIQKAGLSQVIQSKRGKGGGSWVHKNLAPEFLIWVNRAKYQKIIIGAILDNLESGPHEYVA